MADRRTVIADAILVTLARHGGRGLTHRAVDEAAGLPSGSTSYYFRSRAALLEAAVARLADADAEVVAEIEPGDPATAIAAVVESALSGIGRTRTLARYELSLEAARRPELRGPLAEGTARLERLIAGRFGSVVADQGFAGARDLLTFVDGILFAEVTGTGGTPRSREDIRDAIAWMLR